MEKNVAIPIEIYEESQKTARNLGISLTDFFAAALRSYVSKHQYQDVTEKLNEIYKTESSAIDPLILKMQILSLETESW